MKDFAETYYGTLSGLLRAVKVSEAGGKEEDLYSGIETACDLISSCADSGRKVVFIGNGASAAIASHMSTDYWKNGGIRSVAFNDGALLTCISNDYGYEHVFEKPVEMFADKDDVLVAISSSGKSENIIRGVRAGLNKGMRIVTLSGFETDNPLFSMGHVNFHVPAKSYGFVEIIHHSICHCILEGIVVSKTTAQRRNLNE